MTRDTKTGQLYVKLVNTANLAQPVHITLTGAGSVSDTGTAFTLTSASLTGINTLSQPTAVAPVTTTVSGVSRDFTYTAAPSSVTVLRLQLK